MDENPFLASRRPPALVIESATASPSRTSPTSIPTSVPVSNIKLDDIKIIDDHVPIKVRKLHERSQRRSRQIRLKIMQSANAFDTHSPGTLNEAMNMARRAKWITWPLVFAGLHVKRTPTLWLVLIYVALVSCLIECIANLFLKDSGFQSYYSNVVTVLLRTFVLCMWWTMRRTSVFEDIGALARKEKDGPMRVARRAVMLVALFYVAFTVVLFLSVGAWVYPVWKRTDTVFGIVHCVTLTMASIPWAAVVVGITVQLSNFMRCMDVCTDGLFVRIREAMLRAASAPRSPIHVLSVAPPEDSVSQLTVTESMEFKAVDISRLNGHEVCTVAWRLSEVTQQASQHLSWLFAVFFFVCTLALSVGATDIVSYSLGSKTTFESICFDILLVLISVLSTFVLYSAASVTTTFQKWVTDLGKIQFNVGTVSDEGRAKIREWQQDIYNLRPGYYAFSFRISDKAALRILFAMYQFAAFSVLIQLGVHFIALPN
jgi:hypothetical protein